ncbi:MAG: hypothetical protein R2882_15075 [Gemmatimonadales bacterium]
MFVRSTVFVAVALAATAPLAAQQQQQHQHRQGGMEHEGQGMQGMMETPWREMNGFHSLLHLSHQPLMKSNDLAPARRNAGLLADAAEAWAKSTPPAECKAPEDIGEKLTAYAADARAYAALAAENGSDDDVKDRLGKLHDQFEKLHMACMPMGMGKGMGGMGKKGPPPR